jgi:hypothetical protein
MDAIAKLQNEDKSIFAFSSSTVKRYLDAGRGAGWKSLFRAHPFVKWCVLTWGKWNWQKEVEWGSVTGCPIPFLW